MTGIRLQNEGLGVVSVAKYRSCCHSLLQGVEGLLVLGTPKPGYVSCLLLGALGSFAHQVMERPGNPGKPADEPPVITGKVKKAAQLCCRCWCSGPLERPPDSSSTLSPGRCVTLLLQILLASARFYRGVGRGVEGSRSEAWMQIHKSEVAIT